MELSRCLSWWTGAISFSSNGLWVCSSLQFERLFLKVLRGHIRSINSTATRLIREHTSQGPENGSPRNGAVSGRETNGRVPENFRNLFQPCTAHERSTSFSRSSRLQSASAASAPATKRRKRNTTLVFFKRDTWTHEFFCLADKEHMAVPTRSLKNQLQQAGLGCKKICFNSKANATEVKTKLEESYPAKLIAGGGFEILRRGLSPSELSVIPPPNIQDTLYTFYGTVQDWDKQSPT